MAANKEKLEFSDAFWLITSNSIGSDRLNPLDWLKIIEMSLDACEIVLPQVAKNYNKARSFKDLMNYCLVGGAHNEKRVLPEEVSNTLPKELFINYRWIFIPVKILETKEEKGQFFERRLHILSDLAVMVIVDVWYRKEPIVNQKAGCDPPEINEIIVKCQMMFSKKVLGITKEGFEEAILPYFEDSELKLGEHIMKYVFGRAVEELKKAKERAAKIEASMKPLLIARERIGINNII